MGQKKIGIRTGSGIANCKINDSYYIILATGNMRVIEFPIIDGKSPSKMTMLSGDATDIY